MREQRRDRGARSSGCGFSRMGALGKTMAGWWFQTAVEVSIVIAIMLLYICWWFQT